MRSPAKTKLSFGGPISPMVKTMIVINVLFYVCSLLVRNKGFVDGMSYQMILVELLGVSPDRVLKDFAVWQLFSYMFMHLEFFHLLFNMLALYWFGSELEWTWGSKKFLNYYFFAGIGAGLVSTLLKIPTIGASGAIFALLLAYGLMFPNRVLYIYFVIPIKAKYAVMAFGLLELISLLNAGPNTRINHAAHLSGLAFGALWFLYMKYQHHFYALWLSFKQPKRKKPNLKVLRFDKANNEEDEDTKPTIH
ncbi:MAG TPA: rhomboid family intramembrane serine protease [Oligoflexia bacterium]|nr:rhomboid family intramembrane serine protease [Oligoflexia bacterium]HMR25152.1 rhomboid family intramembrane serine protease [Oligoflexia bacterium]